MEKKSGGWGPNMARIDVISKTGPFIPVIDRAGDLIGRRLDERHMDERHMAAVAEGLRTNVI